MQITRELRETGKHVPEKPDVHLMGDNYATHKHPRGKRWREEARHHRDDLTLRFGCEDGPPDQTPRGL